jgi:hypothetical protein
MEKGIRKDEYIWFSLINGGSKVVWLVHSFLLWPRGASLWLHRLVLKFSLQEHSKVFAKCVWLCHKKTSHISPWYRCSHRDVVIAYRKSIPQSMNFSRNRTAHPKHSTKQQVIKQRRKALLSFRPINSWAYSKI